MVGDQPSRPSWVEEHWPAYGRHSKQAAEPALLAWAMTLDHLKPGPRVLLNTLALRIASGLVCRMSVPALAKATGSCPAATRQRIDKLLAAGVLVLKPWRSPGLKDALLGYEFRLIVDDDLRAAAFEEGFKSQRPAVSCDVGTADD